VFRIGDVSSSARARHDSVSTDARIADINDDDDDDDEDPRGDVDGAGVVDDVSGEHKRKRLSAQLSEREGAAASSLAMHTRIPFALRLAVPLCILLTTCTFVASNMSYGALTIAHVALRV
jgi:hypothetical protein